MAKLDKNGHEVLDDSPVAIPVRYTRPPTMYDEVKQLLRSAQFEEYMRSTDQETFEEADDFDVGDDYDPRSIHELSLEEETFQQEPPGPAYERHLRNALDRVKKRGAPAPLPPGEGREGEGKPKE